MNRPATPKFRCVAHGSFRRHFAEIQHSCALFREAGIEVIAPGLSGVSKIVDGFALLESDGRNIDPRFIELLYLRNLKRLGENGFSYFVDPEGYIGKSVSYELGIAQITNVRCFFLASPKDHPAYLHKNSVWKPDDLAAFIDQHHRLPEPKIKPDEKTIHQLWEDLMVPGSVVATGGIIEYDDPKPKREKEILLVKTHKWGGRYSMVGGKVRRHERLSDALIREVKEETGLRATVGSHLCTFDQIRNSGYYLGGVQHIFVDNVVKVGSRKVRLNEEAQEYVWMTARAALRDLPLEPNARHTIELYANRI